MVEELNAELNKRNLPNFEAVANKGPGVVETFSALLKLVVKQTYKNNGQTKIKPSTIDEKIDLSLKNAVERGRATGEIPEQAHTFEHRFNMDSYRDQQSEDRGRDRRIVDQESLLAEAVTTNMALAEKLAPLLADPEGQPFPDGMLAQLLECTGRSSGSILLFKNDEQVMVERDVVLGGRDPLNLVARGWPAMGWSSAASVFTPKSPKTRSIPQKLNSGAQRRRYCDFHCIGGR